MKTIQEYLRNLKSLDEEKSTDFDDTTLLDVWTVVVSSEDTGAEVSNDSFVSDELARAFYEKKKKEFIDNEDATYTISLLHNDEELDSFNYEDEYLIKEDLEDPNSDFDINDFNKLERALWDVLIEEGVKKGKSEKYIKELNSITIREMPHQADDPEDERIVEIIFESSMFSYSFDKNVYSRLDEVLAPYNTKFTSRSDNVSTAYIRYNVNRKNESLNEDSLSDEDRELDADVMINEPAEIPAEDSDVKENPISDTAIKVMDAYQSANKHLDTIKEIVYTKLNCPFFSSYIHNLAHTMPERFDKFGDILHTVNMEIPYPTTEELPEDCKPATIADACGAIKFALDNIKNCLNEFIKATDEEAHGMACAAEACLNDIESEYSFLFRLEAKAAECGDDTVSFDKFVGQYVEHKDDLLESLNEDIINVPGRFSVGDIERKIFGNGAHIARGYIDSFVSIRDRYNKDTLYKALTSMWMRVCINLHHRDEIDDDGWYLYNNGVEWSFNYQDKAFIFISTEDSFDVFADYSGDGEYYKHVIHANHSHCTNAQDINAILEANDDEPAAATPAHEEPRDVAHIERTSNEVKDAVRDAIRSELTASVQTAVKDAVSSNVRDAISLGRGHEAANAVATNITGNIDIDAIVESVMRALRAKINPTTNNSIRNIINNLINNRPIFDADRDTLLRAADLDDGIIG